MPSPKKKVTLYFSAGMLDETQREAIRQDRSISWIIQAAWRIARDEVQRLPGYGGQAGAEPTRADVGRQQETDRLAVVAAGRLVVDLDVVVDRARPWASPVNVPSAPAVAMMPAPVCHVEDGVARERRVARAAGRA